MEAWPNRMAPIVRNTTELLNEFGPIARTIQPFSTKFKRRKTRRSGFLLRLAFAVLYDTVALLNLAFQPPL